MSNNGRIPLAELTQVAGGHLAHGTAIDWNNMREDCLRDTGTLITLTQPDGGYRTYEEQVEAYDRYLAGGPLANKPGTSQHGLGMAVDIWNHASVTAWLNRWAIGYGFRRTNTSEPWHWGHDSETSITPPRHLPQPEDEEDMSLLYYKDADTSVVYSRNPDAAPGEQQLSIVGKSPSATVAYTLGKLDPAKVLTITGPQMAQLVSMYGVKPVSPAAHTVWSGNRPAVKGLTL